MHRLAIPLACLAGLAAVSATPLVLAAGPTGAVRASAAKKPKTMTIACARAGGGKLQYVRRARDCKPRRGRLVRFSAAHPTYACATGTRTGKLFRVADPAACGKPPHEGRSAVVLPHTEDVGFCAAASDRTLVMARSARPKCKRRELALVLKGKPGVANTPPIAAADVATTDRDHPTTIAVLPNDSDPDGQLLSAGSLDTAATKGMATLNGDGTITYDPAGRFASLGAGQTAQDTFTYRASDGEDSSAPATVTVTVSGLNHAPTDITLAGSSVPENAPAGFGLGMLSTADEDGADGHTYSLVDGPGTDNGLFTIGGDTLATAAAFDFEGKSSYTVRVRSDDGHGGTAEKQFTITVADGNDAPTDIGLSGASVTENAPSGTALGTLSTTDQDAGDSHTYTLVPGTGADFQIDGSTLRTAAPLDFEAGGMRSIAVRTSDGHGGTLDKEFTITVGDANDAPTDIGLSATSVAENAAAGTTVGTLSTTDQDAGDSHTYTVVPGGVDDAPLVIDGSTLKTAAVFDYETRAAYLVTVRTDDGHGGTFDRQFTISVGNVNEAPVITMPAGPISLSTSSTATLSPSVSDVDAGSGDLQVSLSVSHGTLELKTANGLSFQSGDPVNATMTFSGTLVAINAALNGLRYDPSAAYVGPDTLSMTVNDLGSTGSGGARSDGPETTAFDVTNGPGNSPR